MKLGGMAPQDGNYGSRPPPVVDADPGVPAGCEASKMSSFHDEVLEHLCTRPQLFARAKWWRRRMADAVRELPTLSDKRLFCAELDRQFVARNFYYFLTRHWKTFYPDGQKKYGTPAVLYPESRMAWTLADILQRYGDTTIVIDKSRQAPMATHEACAYFTWEAMTVPGRFTIFHSKDLIRAGYGGRKGNPECLLGRVKWGFQRLPPHIRAMVAKVEWDTNPNRPQAIFWHYQPDTAEYVPSIIMAIPDASAKDVINSFSPSAIFDDEMGHQKNPEAFWNAAIPAMGGRLFLRIGTPDSREHPEAHAHMFREIIIGDGEEPDWCELMPYSDSFSGSFLNQIMNDDTDYEIGHRFLGRVRNNGIITLRIHSRARAGAPERHPTKAA